MTAPTCRPRWYRVTPDRFLVGLLAAEVLLLLSERFCWFTFNQHKGCTALMAVAALGGGKAADALMVPRQPALPVAIPVQYPVAAAAR